MEKVLYSSNVISETLWFQVKHTHKKSYIWKKVFTNNNLQRQQVNYNTNGTRKSTVGHTLELVQKLTHDPRNGTKVPSQLI